MPRPRSQRPARRARQLDLILTQLRHDPNTTVPELTRLLQDHDLGAHVRTVYRFRDEARALLPPDTPLEPTTGWPLTMAAARLTISRARLKRMTSVVGMPAAQVDRATGVLRWAETDWRALEGRFEAAVLRRPRVVELLSPGRPYAEVELPAPSGWDLHGHWWLAADVEAWVRSGRGQRRRPVTRWTPEDLAEHLRLHPAATEPLRALPGFPDPDKHGRWDAEQVRLWVQGHPDWRGQVAGDATLDMRAAADYVGLSYATVRTYRARGDWPAPDGWHARTPRWSTTTLQTWRTRRR